MPGKVYNVGPHRFSSESKLRTYMGHPRDAHEEKGHEEQLAPNACKALELWEQ